MSNFTHQFYYQDLRIDQKKVYPVNYLQCQSLSYDHDQIMTTKVFALGLGNGEWTRPDSLAYVIHDGSYWSSSLWSNQKRDDQ